MFEGFMIGIINAIQGLIEVFPSIIAWLNEPLKIGFDLPVIGFVGLNLGSPLSMIGIGALVLIGLWAVKKLVPLL